MHKKSKRGLIQTLFQGILNAITRIRGQHYRASLYRDMHERKLFKGVAWRKNLLDVQTAVPELDAKRILDFGCGPNGGLAQELGDRVVSYDPYVPAFARTPWHAQFDVVFSSDVLEHLTFSEIREFFNNVNRSQARYVFLVISTRPAKKQLPNGANAHLTVKPYAWWLKTVHAQLGPRFRPTLAKYDVMRQTIALCFESSVSQQLDKRQAA